MCVVNECTGHKMAQRLLAPQISSKQAWCLARSAGARARLKELRNGVPRLDRGLCRRLASEICNLVLHGHEMVVRSCQRRLIRRMRNLFMSCPSRNVEGDVAGKSQRLIIRAATYEQRGRNDRLPQAIIDTSRR